VRGKGIARVVVRDRKCDGLSQADRTVWLRAWSAGVPVWSVLVVRNLVRSREAVVAVAAGAAVVALWPGTVRPAVVLMGLAVAALAVWFLSRWWEQRTWPATPAFARRPATTSGARTLREDTNAEFFVDRGGFLFRRRQFFTATGLAPVEVDAELLGALNDDLVEPVLVFETPERTWWWLHGTVYWENAGYDVADVHALIARRERRHAQELQRAHTLLEVEQAQVPRRLGIPTDVRRAVFERDGGQCVECQASFDLQYDHVIPVAHGGATSVANLQLLCGACNREKSASI
jgi:hypothetical protein